MLFGFCICSVFSLHAFILQCLVLIEESCTVRMDDWFFSIVSDRTKTWTWTCSFDWILIFFLLSLNFRFPSLLLLGCFHYSEKCWRDRRLYFFSGTCIVLHGGRRVYVVNLRIEHRRCTRRLHVG